MPINTIFAFFKRKKNDTSVVTVDLPVDAWIYKQLTKRADMDGTSESEVLPYSFRRGMSDYWLHVAKLTFLGGL